MKTRLLLILATTYILTASSLAFAGVKKCGRVSFEYEGERKRVSVCAILSDVGNHSATLENPGWASEYPSTMIRANIGLRKNAANKLCRAFGYRKAESYRIKKSDAGFVIVGPMKNHIEATSGRLAVFSYVDCEGPR